MRQRWAIDVWGLSAAMVFACGAGVLAQDADPVSEPAADEAPADDAPTASEPSEETPTSLDDLLGITPEEQDPSASDAAARDRQDELDRELNQQRINDAFRLALEKMTISAALLDERFDPGLGTQRVQEEILAKLDQLIDEARKQASQSGGSSSSSSSSSSTSQANTPPGSRQQDANAGGQRQNQPADARESDPPPMQEGDLATMLEETRSEWGHLPERLRDQIQQGMQTKPSRLYERLTHEYWKRLAEDGSL